MTRNANRHAATQRAKLLLAVALDPREVGKRIAQAREGKGWTQLTFALEADVSPSSVQRWESGKLPPVRELLRVAELLEVDPETLVEPPADSRPQYALLREVADGVADLALTSQELLELGHDLRARIARLEEKDAQRAAAEAH